MTLRPYQQEAVDAFWQHIAERKDSPCVVIPTAGGKTPVMATICRDAVAQWGGRVLILAHVRELLKQTADKLEKVCEGVPYGIYSAGLGKRETTQPVIVAGIQSVYRRAGELDAFDIILVDEAHMIPPEGEGMYRQFLNDAKLVNPNVRVGGLTATPYRMKTGSICTPTGILNHVCYEIGVGDLVLQGYLCKPTSRIGRAEVNTSALHVRAGEYIAEEVEALMTAPGRVEAACAEIVELTRDRKGVLIFASGIAHAESIVLTLCNTHGIECDMVTGDTESKERERILDAFVRGETRYLCNVNVLTTGFDAPVIDCVAILRPTLSPGLYYQMVGRGFRLHPGKENCLVLDFGNNVRRHGPVDRIKARDKKVGSEGGAAPEKMCPECRVMVATGVMVCPECNYEFPSREPKHLAKPATEEVLSGQQTPAQKQPVRTRHEVLEATYSVHTKKGHTPGDGTPQTLKVSYRIGFAAWVSEWVCIEHQGFAQQKARRWWGVRSRMGFPASAREAVRFAEAGALANTVAIEVCTRAGEKYPEIVEHELRPAPEIPWQFDGSLEPEVCYYEVLNLNPWEYAAKDLDASESIFFCDKARDLELSPNLPEDVTDEMLERAGLFLSDPIKRRAYDLHHGFAEPTEEERYGSDSWEEASDFNFGANVAPVATNSISTSTSSTHTAGEGEEESVF